MACCVAVLVARTPSSTVIGANEKGHTFYVDIRDEAFLSVNAYFLISITNVQLSAGEY